MGATIPGKAATYEDLMKVPDHFVAEILDPYVNDERVQAEPFEGVSLKMSRWWLPEAPAE
jgi:hypothetical protein